MCSRAGESHGLSGHQDDSGVRAADRREEDQSI